MVELDDVVGNQSRAPRDEFQSQFAFADATLPGEQHAHAEHVEQHTMARHEFGQRPPQVGAHDPDYLQARQRRGDHRDVTGGSEICQRRRCLLTIRQNDAHQLAAGNALKCFALGLFVQA